MQVTLTLEPFPKILTLTVFGVFKDPKDLTSLKTMNFVSFIMSANDVNPHTDMRGPHRPQDTLIVARNSGTHVLLYHITQFWGSAGPRISGSVIFVNPYEG